MIVIIEDILDSKSREILVGKAVLAIASIEFEVEDEEVAFCGSHCCGFKLWYHERTRGKPKKTEREREREREILVLNEYRDWWMKAWLQLSLLCTIYIPSRKRREISKKISHKLRLTLTKQ